MNIIRKSYTDLSKIVLTTTGQNHCNFALDTLNKIEKVFNKILSDFKERDVLFAERFKILAQYEEVYAKVLGVSQKGMILQADKATAILKSSNIVIFVLLFVLIFGSLGAIAYITLYIIRPLNRFVHATEDLTSGSRDLTIRMVADNKDELSDLARNVNKFIENVQGVIVQVNEVADEVVSSNAELASTMEELNTTFANQTEQVSGIVYEMENIRDISHLSLDKLNETVGVISGTSETTNQGKSELLNVKDQIFEIKTNTAHLSETIDKLQDSSNQIGEILNVINDIADQTNLLALNAAIEAARAGEAGRGFAVVADEVRKLAERTQHATNEIEEIIGTLQNDSEQASKEMESAGESVMSGVEAIDNTSKGFENVVNDVDDLSNTIKILDSNMQSQTDKVDGITDRTTAIVAGIEESNSAVGEVTITVGHLQDITQRLKNLVGQFKIH